jgi:hypothetical protein
LKKLIYIAIFSGGLLSALAQTKKAGSISTEPTKPVLGSEKENANYKEELPVFPIKKFAAADKVEFFDLSSALKADPASVTSLKLRKQGLTEIPADLSRFKNLAELDLSDNEIGDFSSKLGGLNNLQYLNLSGNKLTFIPSDLCNLRNLKTLNLSSNKITSGSVACLNGLERLYLNNNELAVLPVGITDLQSLKALYLHSNKLSILDENLSRLPKLEVLLVQFNKIEEEPNVFRSTPILHYTFNPQNMDSRQLYKYQKSQSIIGSGYQVIATEGISTLAPFESVEKNKRLDRWQRHAKYFAIRGGTGLPWTKGSWDDFPDNDFFDDEFYHGELEFGHENYSISSYMSLTDAVHAVLKVGASYRYFISPLSSRLRPYGKVGVGVNYDFGDEVYGILNLQLRAGVDFYIFRFFGLNIETGLGAGNLVSVGGILRIPYGGR